MQRDLFGAANLAATVVIPPAPVLAPHYEWPYPGLSPEDSARAGLSGSSEYAQVIIATILAYPDRAGTDAQVLALLPDDWKRLLGRVAHGSICDRQGRPHGIAVTHVTHEGPGGGFHLAYRITEDGHV
ncbi:hypothetical protein ISE1_2713 [plant metagenome]